MAQMKLNITGAALASISVVLAKRGPSFYTTTLKDPSSPGGVQMDAETGEKLVAVIGNVHKGFGPKGEDGQPINLEGQVAQVVLPESTYQELEAAANSNGVNALMLTARCNPSISSALIDGEVRATVWVRPTGEFEVGDAPALADRQAEAGLSEVLDLARAGNEERKAEAAATRPSSVRATAAQLLEKLKAKA